MTGMTFDVKTRGGEAVTAWRLPRESSVGFVWHYQDAKGRTFGAFEDGRAYAEHDSPSDIDPATLPPWPIRAGNGQLVDLIGRDADGWIVGRWNSRLCLWSPEGDCGGIIHASGPNVVPDLILRPTPSVPAESGETERRVFEAAEKALCETVGRDPAHRMVRIAAAAALAALSQHEPAR